MKFHYVDSKSGSFRAGRPEFATTQKEWGLAFLGKQIRARRISSAEQENESKLVEKYGTLAFCDISRISASLLDLRPEIYDRDASPPSDVVHAIRDSTVVSEKVRDESQAGTWDFDKATSTTSTCEEIKRVPHKAHLGDF